MQWPVDAAVLTDVIFKLSSKRGRHDAALCAECLVAGPLRVEPFASDKRSVQL
jgi:hypothetical protein